jgi:hypothetical protein
VFHDRCLGAAAQQHMLSSQHARMRWPADPTGLMLNGWAQQFDVITASHAFRPLTKRKAKIMWRGRASDEPRDEVRCCLAPHCPSGVF